MSRTMARESAMPEAIAACAMRKPRKTSIVGAKQAADGGDEEQPEAGEQHRPPAVAVRQRPEHELEDRGQPEVGRDRQRRHAVVGPVPGGDARQRRQDHVEAERRQAGQEHQRHDVRRRPAVEPDGGGGAGRTACGSQPRKRKSPAARAGGRARIGREARDRRQRISVIDPAEVRPSRPDSSS